MKRDWKEARAKVEAEARCSSCGLGAYQEAAHDTERSHDAKPPLRDLGRVWVSPRRVRVHPDRIIPLCGPFPMGCHGAEHRHELDTLPLLSLQEQLQAVADCGGIENARVRLCPSQYKRTESEAA